VIAKDDEFECRAELGELWRLRWSETGADPLDRAAVVRAMLPVCARALRARRAGLWLFDAARTTLAATAIYDRRSDSGYAGETVAAVDHPQLWAVLSLDRPRRDLGGRSIGEPAPGAEVAVAAGRAGHWSTAAAPVGQPPEGGVLWCEPEEPTPRGPSTSSSSSNGPARSWRRRWCAPTRRPPGVRPRFSGSNS